MKRPVERPSPYAIESGGKTSLAVVVKWYGLLSASVHLV
jgi:hypothetical protein